MKKFVVPSPVLLPLDSGPKAYGFADLNAEYVWANPIWRADRNKAELFFALRSKLDSSKPGDVVELTDAEFEVYEPLATLRGQNLNPRLAYEFMMLLRPILFSETT